jgi:hypothetical protein
VILQVAIDHSGMVVPELFAAASEVEPPFSDEE